MYTIELGLLHGVSFAVPLIDVEFLSWRRNEETGDYWVKFHVPSGKEIRVKINEEELRDIIDTWFGWKSGAGHREMNLKIGEEYELDY